MEPKKADSIQKIEDPSEQITEKFVEDHLADLEKDYWELLEDLNLFDDFIEMSGVDRHMWIQSALEHFDTDHEIAKLATMIRPESKLRGKPVTIGRMLIRLRYWRDEKLFSSEHTLAQAYNMLLKQSEEIKDILMYFQYL